MRIRTAPPFQAVERLEWPAQTQARESGEVAVRRNPLASRLDCKGREPCILDEIASDRGGPAEVFENQEVTGPGRHHRALWLFQQDARIGQRIVETAW